MAQAENVERPEMLISLRLATSEDIPALQDLIDQSVRALSAGYYTKEQIDSALTNMFGVDTQLILDQTYFVAEVETEIVGSGGWSKRNTLFGGDQTKAQETDELLTPGVDAARLRAFYVHPQWSRRGIGKLITNACETAARAAGFAKLELIATLPGQPFYSASGYEITGPFDIPLPDGQSLPAFHMEKSLELKPERPANQ